MRAVKTALVLLSDDNARVIPIHKKMYGNKNQNAGVAPIQPAPFGQAAGPQAPTVEPQEQIMIHTMQDHLDRLAGKLPTANAQGKTEVEPPLGSIAPKGSAAPVGQSGSPFLGPLRFSGQSKPGTPVQSGTVQSGQVGQPPVKFDARTGSVPNVPAPRSDVQMPFQTAPQAKIYQNLPPTAFADQMSAVPAAKTVQQPTIQAVSGRTTPGQPSAAVLQKSVAPADSGSSKKIIFGFLGVVSLVALAGGGYYLWSTRYSQDPVQPVVEAPVEPIEPEVPSIPEPEIPVRKYSEENPNYLVIESFSSQTAEAIKATLTRTAQEIMAEGETLPVELVVSDETNGQIPFETFATAAGLKFAPDFMANFTGGFSLFVYNDGGQARLGLVAQINSDKATSGSMAAVVRKTEKTLADNLAMLFLDSPYQLGANEFKDGKYGDSAIRYLNLNPDMNLSVDYAFSGNQWVVGTSKNSIRAILDKLAMPAVPDAGGMAAGSDTPGIPAN